MRSKHLTLDELLELVKQGCEVQVIDSKTREELTATVLAPIRRPALHKPPDELHESPPSVLDSWICPFPGTVAPQPRSPSRTE